MGCLTSVLHRAKTSLLFFTFISKDDVAFFSGTNKQLFDCQMAVRHYQTLVSYFLPHVLTNLIGRKDQ